MKTKSMAGFLIVLVAVGTRIPNVWAAKGAPGSPSPLTEFGLPYTVGTWDTTQPADVELVRGQNVPRISRQGEVKGVTIKDFTLTPVSTRVSQVPAGQ